MRRSRFVFGVAFLVLKLVVEFLLFPFRHLGILGALVAHIIVEHVVA